MSDRKDILGFWDCDTDTFNEAVEREVYEAIKTLLTTNDPDFLKWWFIVVPGQADPVLHLEVEGRKYPDIERDFKLSEMVTEFLQGREGRDGDVYLGSEEKHCITMMLIAFEREAERIREFLAKAKDSAEISL